MIYMEQVDSRINKGNGAEDQSIGFAVLSVPSFYYWVQTFEVFGNLKVNAQEK